MRTSSTTSRTRCSVLEVGKLTQTELGKRVGKSQEWVSQRLRLAEAPAALQDLIIRRQINTSSAIEILQWKNTEHYDAIMHEIGAWTVAGEELPRARVREIIKEITEPGGELYEKPWERGDTSSDEAIALIDNKASFINREANTPESQGGTLIDAPESSELPFVNPEDCKDCDIYDRENDKCPEGCTCDSECEDCFCERAEEEDEEQDLPDEPEPAPADVII